MMQREELCRSLFIKNTFNFLISLPIRRLSSKLWYISVSARFQDINGCFFLQITQYEYEKLFERRSPRNT